MKLRNYKDDNIEFIILGFESSENSDDIDMMFYGEPYNGRYTSLKEAIKAATSGKLYDSIKEIFAENELATLYIGMQEVEDGGSRNTGDENNILHYCTAALFHFDQKFKLIEAYLTPRKTEDGNISDILLSFNEHGATLYYSNDTVDATDYFENECKDKDIANILIKEGKNITY